ncbi:MAG: hypothetical protein AAGA77_23365 [Bacteroidota bacterium]
MRNVVIHFTILLMLLFTSCQEDETLQESTLVQSENTFIRVTESENHILIRVESLSDFTDNRNGDVNQTDYCNISFDINNNGTIDSDIDFGYESPTKHYDICSYYFLENDAITHCGGHATEAIFSESFTTSAASSEPHMIWELSIPKEELNNTRTLAFTVKTIDKGEFNTHPPISKKSNPVLFTFKETLKFEW